MELFSLICNIFLYSCLFVWYGVCERHPEGKNTATPCRNFFHAMRLEGCKEFFLVAMRYEWPNGTLITQIRQDDRRLYFVLSLIPQRIAGFFAEKARGSPLSKI